MANINIEDLKKEHLEDVKNINGYEMSEENTSWFLYGYIYAQAEMLIKSGVYEGCSVTDVVRELIKMCK